MGGHFRRGALLLLALLLLGLLFRYATRTVRRPPPPDAARPAARWAERWHDSVGAAPAGPPVWIGDGWCAAFRDGSVVAWNADGQRRWTLKQAGNRWLAPAAVPGRVILAEEEGNLRALQTADGGVVWFRPEQAGALAQPPVVAPDTDQGLARILAVDASEGILRAFDAADGHVLWQSEACGRTDGPPAARTPFVAFGNCEAAIHLFRAADGRRLARIPLGDDAQVAGGLALDGGRGYLWVRGGTFVAVDLVATSVVWRVPLGETDYFATPVSDPARGIVFTGTFAGEALALRAADGQILWRRPLADTPLDPLLLAHGLLFAGADGVLHLLRAADGAPLMRFDLGQPLTVPVAAPEASEGVMVITDDGYVAVLGPTGSNGSVSGVGL